MYKIQPYNYSQAKKLGVTIKPSTNPKKKIDVFKNNEKVATIGAIGYKDYATYLLEDKKVAEMKRKNYKARHEKDRNVKNSNGYFADKILW